MCGHGSQRKQYRSVCGSRRYAKAKFRRRSGFQRAAIWMEPNAAMERRRWNNIKQGLLCSCWPLERRWKSSGLRNLTALIGRWTFCWCLQMRSRFNPTDCEMNPLDLIVALEDNHQWSDSSRLSARKCSRYEASLAPRWSLREEEREIFRQNEAAFSDEKSATTENSKQNMKGFQHSLCLCLAKNIFSKVKVLILEPETFQKLSALSLEEPGFKFSSERFGFFFFGSYSAVIDSQLGESYFLVEQGTLRAGPTMLRDCNWPGNCKVYFTSVILDSRQSVSISTIY